MNDTIEIDKLLLKVSTLAEIAQKTFERSEKVKLKLSDFSFPKSLKWYIDLKNESYLYFNFPRKRKMKDFEIELIKKINEFNGWDAELFSLLKLTIKFRQDAYARWAGLYGNKTITMNSSTSWNIWSTAIHEVGHAWHFQLCSIAGLHTWPESQKVVNDVATQLGKKVKKESFPSCKKFLQEYVSDYSGTNWNEAFAEIFLYAYKIIERPTQKDLDLQKACLYAIEQYNLRIITEFWNLHNKTHRL